MKKILLGSIFPILLISNVNSAEMASTTMTISVNIAAKEELKMPKKGEGLNRDIIKSRLTTEMSKIDYVPKYIEPSLKFK